MMQSISSYLFLILSSQLSRFSFLSFYFSPLESTQFTQSAFLVLREQRLRCIVRFSVEVCLRFVDSLSIEWFLVLSVAWPLEKTRDCLFGSMIIDFLPLRAASSSFSRLFSSWMVEINILLFFKFSYKFNSLISNYSIQNLPSEQKDRRLTSRTTTNRISPTYEQLFICSLFSRSPDRQFPHTLYSFTRFLIANNRSSWTCCQLLTKLLMQVSMAKMPAKRQLREELFLVASRICSSSSDRSRQFSCMAWVLSRDMWILVTISAILVRALEVEAGARGYYGTSFWLLLSWARIGCSQSERNLICE